MIINGMECVFVELFGEGYYSGQTERHCMFLSKDFYEEHKGTISEYTPYFSELDGKHSEVQGSVSVFEEINEEFITSFAEWCEEPNTWMIDESMFYDLFNEDEILKLNVEGFHNIVCEHVKVVTEKTFICNGVSIKL